MKKWIAGALAAVFLLAACSPQQEKAKERYAGTFYDTFDTVVQLVAYTETEEEFNEYFDALKEIFQELHKEYDNYNRYEGINNIYTINEMAGKEPVPVSDSILDLLEVSRDYYSTYSTKTDISNGALFKVWHDYREDEENPQVPAEEELREAAAHSGMEHIVVDRNAGTVYIDDARVQIDVGAVAKGYATEVAAKKLEEMGLVSGILNSGGNVRTIGKPTDDRNRWGIGIQNPDYLLGKSSEENIEVVYVAGKSVVTSGDYQRFYTVDGKTYHHLIDPDTHYPADYFRAVSIVADDSGLADFLSTAIFLMDYEQGKALIDSIEGAEALWVMKDGEVQYTEGMEKIAYSKGAHATD